MKVFCSKCKYYKTDKWVINHESCHVNAIKRKKIEFTPIKAEIITIYDHFEDPFKKNSKNNCKDYRYNYSHWLVAAIALLMLFGIPLIMA